MVTLLILCYIIVRASSQQQICRTTVAPNGYTVLNCSFANLQEIDIDVKRDSPTLSFIPSLITSRVDEIILDGNLFNSLNASSFNSLRHPETVKKLSLAKNAILFIAPGSFKGLENLEELDLSSNSLFTLNKTSFEGLSKLRRLNLDFNPISTFPHKTFSHLDSLENLSIQSKQFTCNCQIVDFLKFVNRDRSVFLSDSTKCVFPIYMRGIQVSQLKTKNMKRACGTGDFRADVFEIDPHATSIVVYPNEPKNITCRISNTGNTTIEWLRHGEPIANSGRIWSVLEYQKDFITATVRISTIDWSDAGDWTCYAERNGFPLSIGTRIIPISLKSQGCQKEIYMDEKGTIEWAETSVGKSIQAKCQAHSTQKAFRKCENYGWGVPDTSRCSFTSQLTFALWKLLVDGPKENKLSRLFPFLNEVFSPYDAQLACWIIGNSTGQSSHQVLDAVDQLITIGQQNVDKAVLRNVLQGVTIKDKHISNRLSSCQHMILMSLTEFSDFIVEPSPHGGFLFAVGEGRHAICGMQSNLLQEPSGVNAISLSAETVQSLPQITIVRTYHLADQSLFQKGTTMDTRFLAFGPVLGIAVKAVSLRHRKEKIESISPSKAAFRLNFVMKQTPSKVSLGVWSNRVGWTPVSPTACSHRIGPRVAKAILFECNEDFFEMIKGENFTYFTVLQHAATIDQSGRKFGVSLPWWILVVNGFLASSMLIILIVNTKLIRKSVQYSRKLWHCMFNITLLVFLLSLTFSIGINKVFVVHECETIGAVVHFQFLAVIFWIAVATRCAQVKLCDHVSRKLKTQRATHTSRLQRISDIIGLYFFSYGIPSIAVAYCCAIDAGSYAASSHYCLPPSDTHFAILEIGFVFPATIGTGIVIVLSVVALCSKRYLDKARSLPISDPNDMCAGYSIDTHSMDSTVRHKVYSESFYIRSMLIKLSLFLLYAICGYCMVTNYEINQDNDRSYKLFSTLHTLFAVLLSIFMFYSLVASRTSALWSECALQETSHQLLLSGEFGNSANCVEENNQIIYGVCVAPNNTLYSSLPIEEQEQRARAMQRAARKFYRSQKMCRGLGFDVQSSTIIEEAPPELGEQDMWNDEITDFYNVEMRNLSVGGRILASSEVTDTTADISQIRDQ